MIFLKQSTASQEISLGCFVSSTDGDTERAGLTIANTDIKLWKNGATTLASKNSGGATVISNGVYSAVLDATDTSTLGSLDIYVHVATALPIKVMCVVIRAEEYDRMFGANNLSGLLWYGTISAIANGSITLPSGHGIANTQSAMFVPNSGTNALGKSRLIYYSGSGDDFTVDPAWNVGGETIPSGTITGYILASPPTPAVTANLPLVRVDALTTSGAADVNSQVDTSLSDFYAAATVEPTAVPSSTASLLDKLNYVFTKIRNRQTLNKTTGAYVLRNNANNATIGSRTDTDDGTTYVKEKDV